MSFKTTSRAFWKTGTEFDQAATAADAIVSAGLDWTVEKKEISFGRAAGGFKLVEDNFAAVRSDNETALGVVGSRYTPIQNKDAFSFADGIVGIKGAHYHSAGSFQGGRRVWMAIKIDGVVRVMGDDVVEKYLLLANSHDGSGSFCQLLTPFRVTCENSLNGAIRAARKSGDLFSIRHTPGMVLRVEQAQEALGIISAKFDLFGELARKMAATQLTVEASKNFFKAVALKGEEKPGQEIAKKTQAIIDEMSRLFEVGRGSELQSAKGTAWGAYNAVTEYVDHYRGTIGEGDELTANRASAALFGTGSAVKERAWDVAAELAGAGSRNIWA